MIECEAPIKAWGNSFGIVIPKKSVIDNNLKANQRVKVIISPFDTTKVRHIFGKLEEWKTPTSKIKEMLKNDLDSKFMR